MTPEGKQEPFLLDMTLVTSEMLGRYILGKLETTQAWVVPVYDGEPAEAQRANCQKASRPEEIEQILDSGVSIGEMRDKILALFDEVRKEYESQGIYLGTAILEEAKKQEREITLREVGELLDRDDTFDLTRIIRAFKQGEFPEGGRK